MKKMWEFEAMVLKVIDADTIDFIVDLGFHASLTIRTRLLGVDAPELTTPEGRQMRDWVRARYPIGTKVSIETFKSPGDKYGRWLATVSSLPLSFEDNPRGLHTLNGVIYEKVLDLR